MKARNLHVKELIKPNTRQTSAEATIAALEAQPRFNSQPKEGNLKIEGETLEETALGETEGILW